MKYNALQDYFTVPLAGWGVVSHLILIHTHNHRNRVDVDVDVDVDVGIHPNLHPSPSRLHLPRVGGGAQTWDGKWERERGSLSRTV